jgi:hypothetical protein
MRRALLFAVTSLLLGCESPLSLIDPEWSARSGASSLVGHQLGDWYACEEDADCVVVAAICGDYDVVRRTSAESARSYYERRNAEIDCIHVAAPYPRARCSAKRCVAEVDEAEPFTSATRDDGPTRTPRRAPAKQ